MKKITTYKCNASMAAFFGMSIVWGIGIFFTMGFISPLYVFWAAKFFIENTEQITYTRDA